MGSSGEPAPATAPELPSVVQHFLRGWRQAKARSLVTEDALIESVFYGLGSYLAQKHDHREQATKEKLAMADEVAKLKEVLDQRQAVVSEVAKLKEEMARLGQHFLTKETAFKEELKVAHNAEREANRKLHEQRQEYATLMGRVVPLRVELLELKDTLKEKEDKITNLEGKSVTREVLLGKVGVSWPPVNNS